MEQLNFFQLSILLTLANLVKTNRTTYCTPSQQAILQLISRIHGLERKRRALNYALRQLEQRGYIQRIRRISRGKDGRLKTKPTLYIVTRKGWKAVRKLIRISIATAKRIGGFIKKLQTTEAIQYIKQKLNPEERPKAYFRLVEFILSDKKT